MSSISLSDLPADFPQHIPPPRFQIGDRVRWQAQPTQDFGTVIGIQYAPDSYFETWTWKCIIWLDRHSPSRFWITSDTAWETDLESLTVASQPHTTLEDEQS